MKRTCEPRLLIIGDDLSGTADCAVTGARLGLHSVVVLDARLPKLTGEGGEADIARGIDVLAVDADSRRLGAEAAARANIQVWRELGHADTRLYKKIDSTLRGNVAAEVAPLIPLAGMAIVAPAFPAAGRTTRDGRQWLNGVPVEQTEVWRNEGIAGEAAIPSMLAQYDVRTETLSLADVRSDQAALTARLHSMQQGGVHAVVCDSEADDDLRRIAYASASLRGVFWVGSAGLARDLMQALNLGDVAYLGEFATDTRAGAHEPKKPVLAVVGSMSSVSHAQVARLRTEAGEALASFELDPSTLRSIEPAHAQFTSEVSVALQRGLHVVVSLSQTDRTSVADGLLFCQRLAALLVPALRYAGSVIATGGETARALLSAAGIGQLRVVEEIQSGVPLLHAVHSGRRLNVVTKAGGFGHPDTLNRAWRKLAGVQPMPGPARPSSKD